MDVWLKALVAAACVVIIAGGARYAWRDFAATQQGAQAKVVSESPASAEVERSNSEDYLKCRNSLLSSALGEAKRLRDWCRQNDYISYDEQLRVEGVTNHTAP
ncbi:hypothetical protein [Shinella sp. M31]|uniref:hypothetical protein n=1 Tax=Shinella sp. M31 TaxID=3368615 RepID=UPI003BA130E8